MVNPELSLISAKKPQILVLDLIKLQIVKKYTVKNLETFLLDSATPLPRCIKLPRRTCKQSIFY